MITDEPSPNDTYGTGYFSRRCPICHRLWPSGKLAIACWYACDPEGLTKLPISRIGYIMALSPMTTIAAWRHLVENFNAPNRPDPKREDSGENYQAVLKFLRYYRQKRRRLPRRWSVTLSKELGISQPRVVQLRQKAVARGDISEFRS